MYIAFSSTVTKEGFPRPWHCVSPPKQNKYLGSPPGNLTLMGAWGKKPSLEDIPKAEETIWKIFFSLSRMGQPHLLIFCLAGSVLPSALKAISDHFP